MTVNVTYDNGWPDSATVQCDGCTLHATAWAALSDEASLINQARDLAAGVGITDQWGQDWCGDCEFGPEWRDAMTKAVPM